MKTERNIEYDDDGQIEGGYFLVWRAIFESDLKGQVGPLLLYLYLFYKARWKERPSPIKFKGELRELQRGQLIAGVRMLIEETGLSHGMVQRSLGWLKETKRIEMESDTRGTIITVCNYDKYQHTPGYTDTQTVQERYANGTQKVSSQNASGTRVVRDRYASDTTNEIQVMQGTPGTQGTQEVTKREPDVRGENRAGGEKQESRPTTKDERDQWIDAIWTAQKARWTFCELNPSDFPPLDREARIKLGQLIDRFATRKGSYDLRVGALYADAIGDSICVRYCDKKNTFWLPSWRNMTDARKVDEVIVNINEAKLLADGFSELTDYAAWVKEGLEDAEQEHQKRKQQAEASVNNSAHPEATSSDRRPV